MLGSGVREGGVVLEGGRDQGRVWAPPSGKDEGVPRIEWGLGGLGGTCRGRGGHSTAWDSTSWGIQGRDPAEM